MAVKADAEAVKKAAAVKNLMVSLLQRMVEKKKMHRCRQMDGVGLRYGCEKQPQAWREGCHFLLAARLTSSSLRLVVARRVTFSPKDSLLS